jgi:hypothetical protein
MISKKRRSIFLVNNMIGNEMGATTHAYRVIMIPTSVAGIAKLFPMSLSKATGTNSVVLKINAAKARLITLIHCWDSLGADCGAGVWGDKADMVNIKRG